uniref:SJCHGC09838 protein n=1 Tax=Schistosoma japonicum TaxID=6182 RepID=Q5BQR3_SCHJA|nr:SJCHGC09838 protein [Schistosoma japonicum]
MALMHTKICRIEMLAVIMQKSCYYEGKLLDIYQEINVRHWLLEPVFRSVAVNTSSPKPRIAEELLLFGELNVCDGGTLSII